MSYPSVLLFVGLLVMFILSVVFVIPTFYLSLQQSQNPHKILEPWERTNPRASPTTTFSRLEWYRKWLLLPAYTVKNIKEEIVTTNTQICNLIYN